MVVALYFTAKVCKLFYEAVDHRYMYISVAPVLVGVMSAQLNDLDIQYAPRLCSMSSFL